MTAHPLATDPHPLPAPPAPTPLNAEELGIHADRLGTSPDLIKIQSAPSPDMVSVTIGKPDGRTLRRTVPHECWEEPEYRSSLLRDMGLLLA